ncbi:hypothetical protein H6P81_009395 [Aristolochia fimbriata]|uniref:F-box domain-containing protein n=1 Tax=Aristolochia fimbriata TaxID=158543 RepID=A0AAV7EKS8_ARIFI|nr:hypothetical protein H6P81_009395 [Aristolochia fimbriata]
MGVSWWCGERCETSSDLMAETVPDDVFALVFRRLNLDDFFRFGAVCLRLHGISTSYKTDFMTKLFPWLVIRDYLGHFAIFSGVPNHSTRTIHDFVKIRDIDPKFKCHGSSHGWLIVEEREKLWFHIPLVKRKMSLLNPVSGQQLSLPDIGWPDNEKWHPYYCKFVLSSNPSSSSAATGTTTCFVAATAFGLHPPPKDYTLAFARVDRDDHEWTRIKYHRPLEDIIFFKDKLYGIAQDLFCGIIVRVEDMDEAAAARIREIVSLRVLAYKIPGRSYTEIGVISTEEGITVPLEDGEIPSPILPLLTRRPQMSQELFESYLLRRTKTLEVVLYMPFWLAPTM